MGLVRIANIANIRETHLKTLITPIIEGVEGAGADHGAQQWAGDQEILFFWVQFGLKFGLGWIQIQFLDSMELKYL